jgi:hypothetical protein
VRERPLGLLAGPYRGLQHTPQRLGRFFGERLRQRRPAREVAEERAPYDTGGPGDLLSVTS